jgi:hypothetical protein
MQELLGSTHVELASADHGITGWLEVQRLPLEMAEHAGRERAQIGVFLAASGRAAQRQLTSADCNHLQSALADLTQQPRLSEQTRQVQEKYFTEHERLPGRLRGALKEQGTPLITAPEWFLHATPAIEAMIEFGRQAGALAAENMSRTL